MSNKNVYKNSIVLIGPSCVGKTLLSEELSIRTQMPVFSVDDILFFLAEMKNNGLKNTQRGMAKYKKTQQYYAFNYKPIKISKNDQTKVDYLNTSIDNLIEKFQAYDEYFDLKKYKRFYNDYCESCSALLEAGISDEFALFLSQTFTTSFLQDIISDLPCPAIIDVSAADGWFNFNYKPKKSDNEILSMLGYEFDFESAAKAHHEIFSQFGQKVFLCPGEDYKYRQSSDFTQNYILAQNLDRYTKYADLIVSVNGLFYQPDDPVFKKNRYYIDVDGNKTKDKLKNKSEVSSICEQILTGLEELKSYQKI